MPKFDLTISLVLFNTNISEVQHVITLIQSSPLKSKIFVVDNSPINILEEIAKIKDVEYIFTNNNLGYGKGHNIAINKADGISKYHLVINADVNFDPIVLKKALDYMEANPDVGMLSPRIKLLTGEMQYFCRLLPTPFDLFARRFLPGFLKPFFKNRLDNYLLLNKDYSTQMNIPNLPGCFMFMRQSILKTVGGFDESFFMYVEDIDLTRRLHEVSQTMYYPDIVIEHGLARGSYSFSKLTLYHIRSAIYYFNKWGWFNDEKRIQINKNLLKKV